MTDLTIKIEVMTQLFLVLRKCGYKLGVDEYQAGLQALQAGYGGTEEQFLEMVETLWCSSRSQQLDVVRVWGELKQSRIPSIEQKSQSSMKDQSGDLKMIGESVDRSVDCPSIQESSVSKLPSVSTLPVLAPTLDLTEPERILSLKSYYPLSRRDAIYGWRSLRRMVADPYRREVDLVATVKAVCDLGYYLSPVYRRRPRNAARLLLLIDRNGSMTPFHRFSRDLVETAQWESTLASENVLIFYFHNFPGSHLYRDLYLTEPIASADVLKQCDRDTSILIVSDAGAARGYRRQERIRYTTRFLLRLRQQTSLVAWLNPMPNRRWEGSSAEILAYIVQMFQMDRQGFSNAIEVLRGLRSMAGGEL